MKPILLGAAALAALAIANPAQANDRWLVTSCAAPEAPKDTWTMAFDGVNFAAEFWQDSHSATVIRWGPFTATREKTITAVIGGPEDRMNIAMVAAADDRVMLTWVVGKVSGRMICNLAPNSNRKPAAWHDLNDGDHAPPPSLAEAIPHA